jgi:riboflavin kinase/FMN adenylyltransferase
MKLIHAANQLGHGRRKVCLAIGVFDGVHLGHQQIIRQAVADARQHDALALVVTFDRHPSAIVRPDRVPPQIFTHSQKLRAIEALGAETLLEIPFDQAFSEKTGETFIRELVQDLGQVSTVCVGANFLFGHQRSGNVALLQKLGQEIGFQVHGHGALALDGQLVSSTRIREAIRTGQLDAASQMLGGPYGRQNWPSTGLSHRQPRCGQSRAAAERGICRLHPGGWKIISRGAELGPAPHGGLRPAAIAG